MTRSCAIASERPAGRVAVIDLGSNSVRMVVFDGLSRTPVAVFNERVVCGLGRGLQTSGRLNPDGVVLALRSLGRFVGLARAMVVARLDILATAAVREATDGAAFVAGVERDFGVEVRVLSGEEESHLATLGIVCGLPKADGLMGDLGGGSLDLVAINEGAFGEHASLPLGLLWLSEAADGDLNRARCIVEEALGGLPWLAAIRGRTLFPVGGAWRTLASISINQSGYPLHILDNYTLGRGEAVALLGLIAGLGRHTLEKIPGVSRRRLDTLPMAALLLERLIEKTRPSRIVFSAQGMREGQFVSNLPPGARDEDTFLGACVELARRHPRSGVGGEELRDWTGPLFAGEDAEAGGGIEIDRVDADASAGDDLEIGAGFEDLGVGQWEGADHGAVGVAEEVDVFGFGGGCANGVFDVFDAGGGEDAGVGERAAAVDDFQCHGWGFLGGLRRGSMCCGHCTGGRGGGSARRR